MDVVKNKNIYGYDKFFKFRLLFGNGQTRFTNVLPFRSRAVIVIYSFDEISSKAFFVRVIARSANGEMQPFFVPCIPTVLGPTGMVACHASEIARFSVHRLQRPVRVGRHRPQIRQTGRDRGAEVQLHGGR